MKPLVLLKCLGKALVRHVGNAVAFGLGGDVAAKVGEEVWDEWQRECNDAGRRAELQALARAAAEEVRAQVEAVVREVAAGQPLPVRDTVARCLEQAPEMVRAGLRRPEDPAGHSVPANFSIVKSADLLPLLSLEKLAGSMSASRLEDASPAATEESPAAAIVLAVVEGPQRGQRFEFADRATCILGRAADCQPRLPDDQAHRRISRHHCLLDINPPELRVRDFGSMNGTYVNGALIGKRAQGMTPEQGAQLDLLEKDLKDGDRLQLGETVFRVETRGSLAPQELGAPAGGALRRLCARCGKDVAREAGARPGALLCAACRSAPEPLAKHLVALANAGQTELQALKGYRFVKTLGQGGMGAVFLLESSQGQRAPASERWVALKLMLPRVAADERARDRFLREIEATRALQHRHVVSLRAAGAWEGTFFFTMDYCDAGSAHDLQQQRGGKLHVDEAVEIILQALEGLDYAHNVFGPGKGLVHRDLSPHNLLLSGSGSARVAKIADYGLAKAFDQAGLSGYTRTGDTAGKPHFMPRQQVVNFKYAQPAVDVWSMAACLYSMLTGFAPRDFPDGKDRWLVVLETDATPIRERMPTIPARLAEALDLALHDRPALPFGSAADFKSALEIAL